VRKNMVVDRRLDRREFLRGTLAAGGGLALGVTPAVAAGLDTGTGTKSLPESLPGTDGRSTAPKKLLILGGTGFIGPHMVRFAVDRGHEVTIFTRGRTQAEIPDVEHLMGDRNDNLSALEGRDWDVVLDNNARDYRWVRLSTDLLRDAAERYVFVSSISAYSLRDLNLDGVSFPLAAPIMDEDAPLFSRPDDFTEGQEAPYGLSKTLGEEAAEAAFPGRATIVRPGLIVGPGDPTDRFTYWPVRIEEGGEVLAPNDGSDPTQIIDARDLTEWIVRLVEDGVTGHFNATGPRTRMSMAEMLYGIRAVTTGPIKFTWVPFDFLREHGVRPWSDMPAWIPNDPSSLVSVERAVAAGLTFRPLAVTARDVLKFHRGRPEEERNSLQAGMDRERELEVLNEWRAAGG
jgi:2'-hydroxyisoflavone reductase